MGGNVPAPATEPALAGFFYSYRCLSEHRTCDIGFFSDTDVFVRRELGPYTVDDAGTSELITVLRTGDRIGARFTWSDCHLIRSRLDTVEDATGVNRLYYFTENRRRTWVIPPSECNLAHLVVVG